MDCFKHVSTDMAEAGWQDTFQGGGIYTAGWEDPDSGFKVLATVKDCCTMPEEGEDVTIGVYRLFREEGHMEVGDDPVLLMNLSWDDFENECPFTLVEFAQLSKIRRAAVQALMYTAGVCRQSVMEHFDVDGVADALAQHFPE